MSRRRLIPLLLILLLLPALAHARPASNQKPKEIVAGLEDQWRAATLASDPAALDKLLSDDYVGISWNGQVNTKTMQLDRLRNHTLSLTRIDLSDLKIKIVGPVAIVTATAQLEGTIETNEIHGTFRYTRIYQRLANGSWKITNFESTRVNNPGDHIHPHRPPGPILP